MITKTARNFAFLQAHSAHCGGVNNLIMRKAFDELNKHGELHTEGMQRLARLCIIADVSRFTISSGTDTNTYSVRIQPKQISDCLPEDLSIQLFTKSTKSSLTIGLNVRDVNGSISDEGFGCTVFKLTVGSSGITDFSYLYGLLPTLNKQKKKALGLAFNGCLSMLTHERFPVPNEKAQDCALPDYIKLQVVSAMKQFTLGLP